MSTHYPPHPPLSDAFIAELNARFGKRFSQGESIRMQHGRDESVHTPALPDGVVFVESTEEVAELLRLCQTHRTPEKEQ